MIVTKEIDNAQVPSVCEARYMIEERLLLGTLQSVSSVHVNHRAYKAG